MSPYEWQRDAMQDRLDREAEREADRNPRCVVCNTDVDVRQNVDLCAPLCDEHHRAFSLWVDENPDAYYDDWPPVAPEPFVVPRPLVAPRPSTDAAMAEGHASAHGLGVGIVVAVIMALLAGGFITLMTMPAGSPGHALAGWGALALAMGLLHRIVKTGALR